MKVFIVLALVFLSASTCSPVLKGRPSQSLSRSFRSKRQTELELTDVYQLQTDETGNCMHVRSEEGSYSFSSAGGQQVCGLYIITDPDKVVEFEFEDFDIGCNKGGLLSVIDGWELNGQFFPGNDDHPKPLGQRYSEYCGSKKPWKSFTMSQNVGLLEFRVPIENNGFTVSVRFRENSKPCNVVYQSPMGVHTLRNYGRRSNCSISIIFPESIQILATSVGVQTPSQNSRNLDSETGILRKCKKRGLEDYVEIKGGDGLDPGTMNVVDDICGLDSLPSKRSLDIVCGNTAVRLVSSGRFENSVTFSFQHVMDLSSPAYICPSLLASL